MVLMAVGQGDFFNIREFEPQAMELHEGGIIIAGIDNGQIISLDQINIATKLIPKEEEGFLEQGFIDLQELGQRLPIFLGMELVVAHFIHWL
jgi:hypothetical protein